MHRLIGAGLLAFALLSPLAAVAHGIVGMRFFPATLAVDDPFVADEAALPTVSTHTESASADGPKTRESEIEYEFAKRLTPHLGISVGQAYVFRDPAGKGGATQGFSNLGIGARYQFLTAPEHEAVASFDLGFELGGTGARQVEADRFSAVTPALLFGKGFGDLPEALAYLRPLAVTGMLGGTIPFSRKTRSVTIDEATGDVDTEIARHPSTIVYGLTLQYSLAYLSANVRDVGLSAFARRLVPLVELAFETPVDAPGEVTTGTVNPGLLWTGQKIQLGLEAIIPVNTASGADVGVRAQLHLYLDDLISNRPLFGG
jgi:hypothetical protein